MMQRKDDTNLRIKKELEGKIRDDMQSIPEEVHITQQRLKTLYQSSMKARGHPDDLTSSTSGNFSNHSQKMKRESQFERGPRVEMLAMRQDLHNTYKKPQLPVNEWVPPLGSTGGTGGPRNWPREADVTSSLKNSIHKDMSLSKPSYARETTVTRSALQNALFSGNQISSLQQQQDNAYDISSMMRSTQRIVQKESNESAILLTDALEERKQRQLEHADWLSSSSTTSSTKKGNSKSAGVKHAAYGAEQSVAMGVSAAPNSVYRRNMRALGSGVHKKQLSKQSNLKQFGQIKGYVKPSHSQLHEGVLSQCNYDPQLEHAIAKKHKARALRFRRRITSGAQFLDRVQHAYGARPGNQDLIRLHHHLRKCGNENSDPLVISRSQFMTITKHVFPESYSQDHKIISDFFSCFDPLYHDRIRFDSIVAALVLINRPDVYKLIGFLGAGHSSPFSELIPVLKAVFELYGSKPEKVGGPNEAQPLVSADDCRDLFLLAALNEDDYLSMDSLWSVASVDLFNLRPRSKVRQLAWEEFITKLENQNGAPVLSEYQRQVDEYQRAVKAAKTSTS